MHAERKTYINESHFLSGGRLWNERQSTQQMGWPPKMFLHNYGKFAYPRLPAVALYYRLLGTERRSYVSLYQSLPIMILFPWLRFRNGFSELNGLIAIWGQL